MSTDALNVICNFEPIDLWLKRRAVEYFVKHNINNELSQKYLEYINIDNNLVQRPVNVWSLRPHGLRHQMKSRTNVTFNKIYTYGVKCNAGTGAAFSAQICGRQTNKKLKLSESCSAFQSKLFAIFSAFKFINSKIKTSCVITVVTDKCSIMALNDQNSTNYLVNKIHNEYYKCEEAGFKVFLCAATESNQEIREIEIKELVKQAITSHNKIAFELVSMESIKKLLKDKNINFWDQRWQQIPTGVGTKKFFPSVYSRIKCGKKFVFKFELTQIVTNHGNLNSYLKRFGIKDNDNCEQCMGRLDDAFHRIFECRRFERERLEFKRETERLGYQWPTESTQFMTKELIDNFINFSLKIV